MTLKKIVLGVAGIMAMAASQAWAQNEKTRLDTQNIAKQPFAFTITAEPSAQGEHFMVKIDPKLQPVKFLRASLSVNDASMIESSQVKGVYDNRTISTCTIARVTPEGEEGVAAYGFFVATPYLENSTFVISMADPSQQRSFSSYWFFLKDFVPSKQISIRKKQPAKPLKQIRQNTH